MIKILELFGGIGAPRKARKELEAQLFEFDNTIDILEELA